MLQLKGAFTAVITPFRDGKPDLPALKKLVRFQVKSGINGIVPCGSTGEAATLTPEEYLAVIKTVVDEVKGRVPVVPGCGTNSTAKSVETLKKIEKLGISGVLAVVPYYNKPPQAGLLAHFSEIASGTRLPVVLYNIPGRTGVNMLPATVLELRRKFSNIVGIKEASGSLDQVSEIVNGADKDFTVMSGDDSLTLPMMSVGARGVISVVSNIAPAGTAEMCAMFLR
ncbi:MAG: 4-hydroxy-tetrahydrodipicolinate synthase, partial [Elusimicrobia bacterium RIFOXYB2_FULL_62_6]